MRIKSKTMSHLNKERDILARMIVDTSFLQKMRNVAKPELFSNTYSALISRWVWDYFERTKEAPGQDMSALFQSHKGEVNDDDDLENIETFLSRLSRDWERYNVGSSTFNAQEAEKFFQIRSLTGLQEDLEDILATGDPTEGNALVSRYERPQAMSGTGVNLFGPVDAITAAFDETDEVLFNYPGALGHVTGPFLRGELAGVVAATGLGKTWAMLEAAKRAAMAGHKVLFVSAEMTERMMVRRAWQSLTATTRHNEKIWLPRFDLQDGEQIVVRGKEEFREAPEWTGEMVERTQQRWKMLMRSGSLRIVSFPRFKVSVADVENHITNLRHFDDWMPDFVVMDYADIFKPGYRSGNHLEDENTVWMEMAGMCQEMDIGGLTGTQGNRKSYNRDGGRDGVGGTYDKVSHVGKMYSLNQTPNEREIGVMRIEALKQRDGAWVTDQALILQCLNIGAWYIDSRHKRDVILFDEEEEMED